MRLEQKTGQGDLQDPTVSAQTDEEEDSARKGSTTDLERTLTQVLAQCRGTRQLMIFTGPYTDNTWLEYTLEAKFSNSGDIYFVSSAFCSFHIGHTLRIVS